MAKAIVYTQDDGSVAVLKPFEGARLARSVTLADGAVLKRAAPVKVDEFCRQWPLEGAVADWAETEDQFVARIAAKDLPPGAKGVRVVDAADIPARDKRAAWHARIVK